MLTIIPSVARIPNWQAINWQGKWPTHISDEKEGDLDGDLDFQGGSEGVLLSCGNPSVSVEVFKTVPGKSVMQIV